MTVAFTKMIGLWVWVFPAGADGVFGAEAHVQVCLIGCLICVFGVYTALLCPVLLHALNGRWTLRLLATVSLVSGTAYLLMIFGFLQYVELRNVDRWTILDNAMAQLKGVATLLLLYLILAVLLVTWQVLRRKDGELIAACGTSMDKPRIR